MILKNGKRIDGCTDTLPVGTVQPFLGLTPPLGYLVCQGQLISKVEYPELYRICGSTFGTETDTHFYLPDLRGKTIAGYDSSDTTMNTIGKLLGSKTHKHSVNDHHHLLPYLDIASGGLAIMDTASYNKNFSYPITQPEDGNWSFIMDGKLSAVGTAGGQHGTSTCTGLQTANSNNFQPTITLNWIVKAAMLIPEYFIVENTLTSTSTSNALSAAQGKILDNKITELKNAQNIIGSSYKYTLTASGEQPAWGWYPIGNEYTTGIIPAGRYIVRYGATVSSGATIITFNPYLDGGRTSTATRATIAGPGSEGLLVSGQNIIWKEFTTDATHTINTYVYTNGATTASAIEVEFIRIG